MGERLSAERLEEIRLASREGAELGEFEVEILTEHVADLLAEVDALRAELNEKEAKRG